MQNTAKISVVVIGLGYIGLPTAVALANAGIRVHGYDLSSQRVQDVAAGRLPFVEPGLGAALLAAHESANLSASEEILEAQTYIIAVPTPFNADKSADLSYIQQAATALAPVLPEGALVILESTSPPGTTEFMANILMQARPDIADTLRFAHCPERVLPGKIMEELVTNDRIVGGITPEAGQAAKEVYESFCKGEIFLTNARTAELAKLAENSFRDVNIAFANELAKVCDRLNIDVWELIELSNKHPRVNILRPGPGVGGHCIAIDPWFIVQAAPQEAQLIACARKVNDSRPFDVISQVDEILKDANKPAKIVVLGLAFKPDVDDLRTSPALSIAKELATNESYVLSVVEPFVSKLPAVFDSFNNVELSNWDEALDKADLVLALVAHSAFKTRAKPEGVRLLDTCGLWR